MMRLLLAIAICSYWIISQASEQGDIPSLPDPLSLQQAISLIDESYPDLESGKMDIERARADLLQAESETSLRVTADMRLRWIEQDPDREREDPEDQDHSLGLTLTKPLYDSGYSSYLKSAALLDINAQTLRYMSTRDRFVISVMQHFFDVILADLESSRDTEHMAITYVRMDRAKDRHELGQASDLELLDWQSRYQDARRQKYESDGKARRTRAALALILNRPGQQPSNLSMPDLDLDKMQLPEVEDLINLVLSKNRKLLSLGKAIEAAHSRVEAARVKYGPRINGTVERMEATRSTAASDKWRVGVELEVPLYDGGRSDAAVFQAQTELTQARIDQKRTELQLRGMVRDLWEEIRVLQAEGDASSAFADFRELSMDRSRTLYELEVKSDLGDAMTDISRANLRTARQRFDLALALAKLNALAGFPVTEWRALSNKTSQENGVIQ